MLTIDEQNDVVDYVIRTYRKRHLRLAAGTEEDMRQEGHVALARALRTADPARGPVKGYAWRAVHLHVGRWLWGQAFTTVALPAKTVRKHLGSVSTAGPNTLATLMARDTIADAETADWRACVRREMERLAARKRIPHCCVEVVLNNATAEEIAARFALPPKVVQRSAKRLRVLVGKSKRIERLWKDL